MIGQYEIGSEHTPGEMPGQVQIEAATRHEAEFVVAPEDFRRKAMFAEESFDKWGKIARAISYLGPGREVEEFDLVNSGGDPGVAAAPLPTAVD